MDLNTVRVKVADIIYDDAIWCRQQLNAEQVEIFEGIYRERGTDALPPLEVFGPDAEGQYLLTDGNHRYEAAYNTGMEEVPAILYAPPDRSSLEAIRRGLFLRGLELTAKSSAPLTPEEKKQNAIRLMQQMGFSQTDAAREVGVTPRTLYNWLHPQQTEAQAQTGNVSGPKKQASSKKQTGNVSGLEQKAPALVFAEGFFDLHDAVCDVPREQLADTIAQEIRAGFAEVEPQETALWLELLGTSAVLAAQE